MGYLHHDLVWPLVLLAIGCAAPVLGLPMSGLSMDWTEHKQG